MLCRCPFTAMQPLNLTRQNRWRMLSGQVARPCLFAHFKSYQENFEQRIRSITGALGVTAVSSGMAAISNVFFTIAKSGDNIITSKHLFGNTYSFLTSTLHAFGVETRFCDLTDSREVANAVNERTIAIFFETITNPQLEIADIALLSKVAKEHGVLLIADSTLTPPNIFAASAYGVDIEIISSTKMITGGATSMGGLVLDYGQFDWSGFAKLSELAQRFGPYTFNAKLRKEIFRTWVHACPLITLIYKALDLKPFR